jgi:hypothetical protein
LILRHIRTPNSTNRRKRVTYKTLLRPNSSGAYWRRVFFSGGGLVAASTCSFFHHRCECGMLPPSPDKTTSDKKTQSQKKYRVKNSSSITPNNIAYFRSEVACYHTRKRRYTSVRRCLFVLAVNCLYTSYFDFLALPLFEHLLPVGDPLLIAAPIIHSQTATCPITFSTSTNNLVRNYRHYNSLSFLHKTLVRPSIVFNDALAGRPSFFSISRLPNAPSRKRIFSGDHRSS